MILSQPGFSVQPTGASARPEDWFLCFDQGKVLLDVSGQTPRLARVGQLDCSGFASFELAHTEEKTIFSCHPFESAVPPASEELAYLELGVFRSLPEETAAPIASCWHLWNWYQTHRFCGRCGQPFTSDSAVRALRCTHCGRMAFPVIAPAIIVAITCGDSILLARSARGNFRRFALIAGYVEIGETLEHALRREVMEETGLTLQSIRYLGDQPWGISGSHMFAFHAQADKHQPLRIQKSELSEVRWFCRDELAPCDNTISIAFDLIERFRLGVL